MEESQLPSSNVALESKLGAVLSVHPHSLVPPQTSAQSFSQSFVGSSSQIPQLSSTELPLTTPLQSKSLDSPIVSSVSQHIVIKANRNGNVDIFFIRKFNLFSFDKSLFLFTNSVNADLSVETFG